MTIENSKVVTLEPSLDRTQEEGINRHWSHSSLLVMRDLGEGVAERASSNHIRAGSLGVSSPLRFWERHLLIPKLSRLLHGHQSVRKRRKGSEKVHICQTRTQEIEARGSGVQGQP